MLRTVLLLGLIGCASPPKTSNAGEFNEDQMSDDTGGGSGTSDDTGGGSGPGDDTGGGSGPGDDTGGGSGGPDRDGPPMEAVAFCAGGGISSGDNVVAITCTAPADIASGISTSSSFTWIPGPISFIAPRDI